MTHQFKWFLVLSVAAHAAVLFTWVTPLPETGNPGQVVLLDIADKAGGLATLPASDPGNQPDTRTEHQAPAHEPVDMASHAISGSPGKTNTDSRDNHQTGSPDGEPIETDSPDTLVASSPLPSQKESDRHLRIRILELVTQRLTYPAMARRKGWQGTVTLELHIESDGLISGLQVNETSGYPALDRAAMKALQLASIPGARHWLQGRSIDMLIPVEYRLLDS